MAARLEVRVTADIIPCTRSEFEEEKHEIDSLPRAATQRGRKTLRFAT